jgi:maltooligosyltrehalose trehalohydrolase
MGERFSAMLEYEQLKLAAGTVILSPCLPLLFMGQEYGELAPFLYFVSHSDPDLIEAVRQGRRREFAAFPWKNEAPDAQAVETFERSRLDHSLRKSGRHRVLLEFYRHLIATRKHVPALKELHRDVADVVVSGEAIVMHRRSTSNDAIVVLHFGARPSDVTVSADAGHWRKSLDSSEQRWMGPGSQMAEDLDSSGTMCLAMAPNSICLLQRRL